MDPAYCIGLVWVPLVAVKPRLQAAGVEQYAHGLLPGAQFRFRQGLEESVIRTRPGLAGRLTGVPAPWARRPSGARPGFRPWRE